jgi:exodeoxyribonuclease VII small subunit
MAVKKAQISFEESLARLENIVQAMEDGKLTLDETSKLYEEGIQLAAYCKGRLTLMRNKATKLAEEDGVLKEVDFDDADE